MHVPHSSICTLPLLLLLVLWTLRHILFKLMFELVCTEGAESAAVDLLVAVLIIKYLHAECTIMTFNCNNVSLSLSFPLYFVPFL